MKRFLTRVLPLALVAFAIFALIVIMLPTKKTNQLKTALAGIPKAIGVYLSSDGTGHAGTWTPMTVSGGTTLSYIPTGYGAYCSTDGTGHAGTWAPCKPTPSVAHAFFGGFSGTAFTSLATNYGGGPLIGVNLTTVGMTVHLDTTPLTCVTPAQVGLYDEGTNPAAPSGTLVTGSTITFTNGVQDYHVTFAATLTAGHLYNWGTVAQQVTCGTPASSPHFNVEVFTQ